MKEVLPETLDSRPSGSLIPDGEFTLGPLVLRYAASPLRQVHFLAALIQVSGKVRIPGVGWGQIERLRAF
jgi:hypothetical protein